MTTEHEHDWRHEPSLVLPTYPPDERLVCVECGAVWGELLAGEQSWQYGVKWTTSRDPDRIIIGMPEESRPELVESVHRRMVIRGPWEETPWPRRS